MSDHEEPTAAADAAISNPWVEACALLRLPAGRIALVVLGLGKSDELLSATVRLMGDEEGQTLGSSGPLKNESSHLWYQYSPYR